jgi:hypothetical protein
LQKRISLLHDSILKALLPNLFLRTIFFMKKYLLLILPTLCALHSISQTSYLKLKVFYAIGGTPRELKQGMKDAGLDKPATVGFTATYPRSSKTPSAVLEGGKFISEKKSVSVIAGLQEAGWVKGYNGMQGLRIDYINWIVNPKFNFHGKGAVFGAGFSALLANYKRNKHDFAEPYNHSRVLPGISLDAESVSKKTKGFRWGVFASLNLYSSFEMEPTKVESNGVSFYFKSDINPSSLNMGLRFQF